MPRTPHSFRPVALLAALAAALLFTFADAQDEDWVASRGLRSNTGYFVNHVLPYAGAPPTGTAKPASRLTGSLVGEGRETRA